MNATRRGEDPKWYPMTDGGDSLAFGKGCRVVWCAGQFGQGHQIPRLKGYATLQYVEPRAYESMQETDSLASLNLTDDISTWSYLGDLTCLFHAVFEPIMLPAKPWLRTSWQTCWVCGCNPTAVHGRAGRKGWVSNGPRQHRTLQLFCVLVLQVGVFSGPTLILGIPGYCI